MLVLRNAGPKGAPGMPEAGYLPIPKKLARAGVKDMVRISDARMSGTAFGTIVLHITPESAVGGPLALVQNGDMIRLDVAKRSIELLVDEAELKKRHAALKPAATGNGRGAAMAGFSTRPFCRPTKAATSISCGAKGRGRRPNLRHCERSDSNPVCYLRGSSLDCFAFVLAMTTEADISQLRYVSRLIDNQTAAMG